MAAKGKNQVVLKEIMEFAEYLGMDPVEDGDQERVVTAISRRQ